jgi:hypothetical protein
VIYSAYAMDDGKGSVSLVVVMDGFDSADQANQFLNAVMLPWHDEVWPESDTRH